MATRRTRTVHTPAVGAKKTARPQRRARSTLFVNSVEKGFAVLKAFGSARPRLTLSQIASEAEMDLSTAQRFTYTLTELGYLEKDEETKSYSLSPQVFELSYHYLNANELMQRAAPYLQQLSVQTGETTNITVLHGSDIVYVHRILSQHMLNVTTMVGARQPAFCTAPGLAMLAWLPEERVEAILAATELVKHTPYTITDPKAIRERLAKVRATGYAHTEGEYILGAISTSTAVRDSRGTIFGAINVAVAKHRWKPEDEPRIADLLITTAAAIANR
ncbi:MAG: IclR family transcriptional regulator [Ideonella sp.]|nr:IclR family transcriptional regulator [Ideonella sp.]